VTRLLSAAASTLVHDSIHLLLVLVADVSCGGGGNFSVVLTLNAVL